jgi:hypothetical protein
MCVPFIICVSAVLSLSFLVFYTNKIKSNKVNIEAVRGTASRDKVKKGTEE